MAGHLFLVGTPLGNLEDITLRALRVLKEVDLIAAEDTRRTRELLSYYNIHKPLTSFHQHNRKEKGPVLIRLLKEGKDIALVTDAGMPGISDPGEDLVREALKADIEVVPVPGPSAVITALVVSGLPTRRFVFEGFLPRKGKERQERIAELATEQRTLVLFEAPHRLSRTLRELLEAWGDRMVAVGRELTKKFETVFRGTLHTALQYFEENPPRGECTLVVAGAPKEAPAFIPEEAVLLVEALQKAGRPRKEALAQVARFYGRPRREIYKACLLKKA
ncbi:16S rRNA (cytidine1402-2'-O)-methyltransferase [Thermanaeromonas toyohensis ToBE]|uniref:Ribosomal RNA small subunit methyltransferase I n=1 Tax=Thermanaeromonas toyohensis ToBE TaxID=698762 RepID=A0A1W1V811_9FIRM|nr:16S rRNA (cytidine(1402)-2'-O)-methyltransferase [Thermanaeromonas toyohensis]SMB89320.1 16S rRNA (cytidine1402-2'-O)-methyltransferase [Thermanaeromonas toyohensis ToBE]